MKQLLLLGCALLTSCGAQIEESVAVPPQAVKQITVDPPLEILEIAEVTTPAIRSQAIQITDTVPPPPKPSARDICNGLVWVHDDPTASDICFRAVTAERGWSSSKTASWMHFVVHDNKSVIQGESMFCWNLRKGGSIVPYSNCVLERQGRGEDTGLGQATRVWYGPNGSLCRTFGYCSREQILASPYDSMLSSIVMLIELAGSDPWCWNSWAIGYHDCGNAPDR